MTGSATVRAMLSGRAFQVAGPACENACSPNFVRSVVESSPSMRWKMSVARNVICWRRLTELFPSDTPGCDRSGWRGQGSTAWTLFCSWPAASAAGSGSAWRARSDSSRTPVGQLHSGRAVVAAAWTRQHAVTVVQPGHHERHVYQLRSRPHDCTLTANDDTRNFIYRLLHCDIYWFVTILSFLSHSLRCVMSSFH